MENEELVYESVTERETALRVIEDLLQKTEDDPKRRAFYERQRVRILRSSVKDRLSGPTGSCGVVPGH